jgi:lysozyme family protein
MTDAVLAAVRGRDATDLVARLCDERLAFLKQIKTWPVFGAGWGRRVAEVRAVALTMAKAVPASGASPVPPTTPSAAATPVLGKVLDALAELWRMWRNRNTQPTAGERP